MRNNPRTEVVSGKVTVETLRRLAAAIRRLGLTSRTEAINRAIETWLALMVVRMRGHESS